MKGVKAGYIEGFNYISYRNRTHQFHMFNEGFGISEKVLDFLYSQKIDKIIINFENQLIFSVDINKFTFNSKEYNDEGDKQLILEGQFWNREILTSKQVRLEL